MYLITHTITSIIKTVSTFLIINFVDNICVPRRGFYFTIKKKKKKSNRHATRESTDAHRSF